MNLPCEKCRTLMIDWPGTKDRHPIPVLCPSCEAEEVKRLKRSETMKIRPRSERQKREEPF